MNKGWVVLSLKSLTDLPCPINLNMWWAFGSMMCLILGVQLVSGFILSCHYTATTDLAYDSVVHIMQNVNLGWAIRSVHSNGASIFFVMIYAHIGRGVYYHSFYMKKVWTVGVALYLLLMCVAFLGYVLPWGQMSYWGATVITSLFSAVPLVGSVITKWMWGGYVVGEATLKRFFILHILLPFVLGISVLLHTHFLHQEGSGNPLGVESGADLVPFHPYYSFKDLLGMVGCTLVFSLAVFYFPDLFGSSDNFIKANPYKTPLHIQPEWYFLFAYAILRSVPSKGGGVTALALSVMVLLVLPLHPKAFHLGLAFYPLGQVLFWGFVSCFLMLSFVGARPVEDPFFLVGCLSSLYYFTYTLLSWLANMGWDWAMSHLLFSFYTSHPIEQSGYMKYNFEASSFGSNKASVLAGSAGSAKSSGWSVLSLVKSLWSSLKAGVLSLSEDKPKMGRIKFRKLKSLREMGKKRNCNFHKFKLEKGYGSFSNSKSYQFPLSMGRERMSQSIEMLISTNFNLSCEAEKVKLENGELKSKIGSVALENTKLKSELDKVVSEKKLTEKSLEDMTTYLFKYNEVKQKCEDLKMKLVEAKSEDVEVYKKEVWVLEEQVKSLSKEYAYSVLQNMDLQRDLISLYKEIGDLSNKLGMALMANKKLEMVVEELESKVKDLSKDTP